jgi:hypothetical protein
VRISAIRIKKRLASINSGCSLELDHRKVVRESFPNNALSGSQTQATAFPGGKVTSKKCLVNKRLMPRSTSSAEKRHDEPSELTLMLALIHLRLGRK